MLRHSTHDILAGSKTAASTRTRDIAYEYVIRLPSLCVRIHARESIRKRHRVGYPIYYS